MALRTRTARFAAAAAGAVLAGLGALGAAAAPASATGAFGCEASALRGTLLGAGAVEPVVANRGAPSCRTASSGLDVPIAPLLSAQAGSANTVLSGPTDRVDKQSAVATGGLSDVRVMSLPSLPVTLPALAQVQQSIDAASTLNVPLSGTLAILLGPTLTLDIGDALEALVPAYGLPTAELLRVQGVVAYAGARCVDGAPELRGAGVTTGISVLGQSLPTGQALDEVLTLVDSGSIDPSNVSLALIDGIPVVSSLLAPTLNGLIENALDALPDIAIPATLANVKVTPGGKTETADSLVQHGLRAEVSIAGTSIADVVVGEAIVRSAGVDCTPPPAQPKQVSPEAAAADLVLGCTTRRLVLTDVRARGGRVRLEGVADRSLAGKRVNIVFGHTGRTVATPTITADGQFSASAKLPPKRLRHTNQARYVASVGRERSLSLKLERRMIVTRAEHANGKVTLAGHVTRPLSRPPSAIVVSRRVSCKSTEVVARVKPSASGRFSVTLDAPEGELAVVYRLTSRVRKTTKSSKTYPTFTLPRAIALD